MIYTWILIKKIDNSFIMAHRQTTEPSCGEPDKLEWKEWNKPLPDNIETVSYKYSKGSLIRS